MFKFQKLKRFGVANIWNKFQKLPTIDFVIGKVEPLKFWRLSNKRTQIFLPVHMLILSQTIIFEVKLFEVLTPQQCFKDIGKTHGRNIITFDL